MRAVIQRSGPASVRVEDQITGEIESGLVILLAVRQDDSQIESAYLADKIANLRIFSDAQGKKNLSLLETRGEALVVSQFTLYGDCRKGRRPAFIEAAAPEVALPLYEDFISELRRQGISVQTGVFQAHMQIQLINDGPVTLILDSKTD